MKTHEIFYYENSILLNNQYMHLAFIAHTRACQMYMTIMCMRLKRVLHFIMLLTIVQDDGAAEALQRMNYLIE